jgi:hypothetical protein
VICHWKLGLTYSTFRHVTNWCNLSRTSERFFLIWLTMITIIYIPIQRRKRNRQGRFCRTTIHDRQFVSFIQYFLHRCANIKLAKLWIRPPKRRNGHPFILVHNKGRPFRELPLPDIPILKNITDFKEILIRFVSSVQRNFVYFQYLQLF